MDFVMDESSEHSEEPREARTAARRQGVGPVVPEVSTTGRGIAMRPLPELGGVVDWG